MAASNGSSDQQYQSYPSPTQHNSNSPFYHDHSRRPSHLLHNGSPQDTDSSAQQEEQGSRPSISDDPQLHANLETLIRTFGTPEMQHMGIYGAPGSGFVDQPPTVLSRNSGSPTNMAIPSAGRQKERQKVSRACDECRRKKIRCDAVDETGLTPCTNCARTLATCAFSRQPLKRGPSKGYIKELSERLNTLEAQVHPPHMQQQAQAEIQHLQQTMRDGLQNFEAPGQMSLDPRVGDKRTFDAAEGMSGGHSQLQSRPAPAPPMQMMPVGRPHSSATQQQQYTPQFEARLPLAEHAQVIQPFWRRGGNDNRQEPASASCDHEPTMNITSFDWNENVVDEYHRIIHQTFPLLPTNKARLRQRLAECPASLREAFVTALDCLMRTFPTTTLPPNDAYPQALKKAAELLAKYPFDNPSTHTNATNLVYLQTLLLMVLECDNHGPATIRGQAGPSRAEWLGRAAGVAGQLEINVIRSASQSVMDGDRDSEERLSRRVWWVLFILDRWHASSTADLLKLPENSVVLLPEDQYLLGESTYHLARLSFIIGHLAAILTTTKTPSTDVMAPSNPASSLLGLTLAGEIDRFRESVESVWGTLNLVHLSYHHCHLLIKRLSPTTEPSELVGHAVKVATVLNSRLTPVTPLNHQFGALAAMTLCELCDVPKTRPEALKGLEHMAEALGEGRGLAGKLDSQGWDGAIREMVLEKRSRMRAADHDDGGAGGVGRDEDDGSDFDPTRLTRYGYLTALGQGRFETK
nr:putative transcriptional regulatory protein [Quercus suber]